MEKQHRQETVYENTRHNFPPMDKGTKQSQTCYNCGGTYPHEGMPCRVTRKACHNCLKTGHFVRDCKSEHKQPFRKPRAPQNQYQSQANRLNPLNQDPQHQTLPLEITAQGAPEDSNRMLIKMPNSLLSIVTHASHSDMVTPPTTSTTTPTALQTMGQASHGFLWSVSHRGNNTCCCFQK